VRAEAALRISFGYDPSSGNFPARGIPSTIYARRPTTRMGALAVLRDAWLLGRLAGTKAEDGDHAALARAAAGEIPVRALARHAEDLRTILRLREELGIAPVVEGVAEGYRVAARLAEAKVGCVVGPVAWPVTGRGPEATEPALDNAGALHRAGVALALTAGGDAAGLRDQAALAARYGLPRAEALRAVTSRAAELCGVADRVGTLAAGRDADLVAFDGDPLEPSSRVRLVIVDGEVVFEAEEAK
jgi:imidazolonepropionase-like amidohydrolase